MNTHTINYWRTKAEEYQRLSHMLLYIIVKDIEEEQLSDEKDEG